MATSSEQQLYEKYLNILGCERKEPSLAALRELVLAQLTRIPFESLSKIYYKKQEGLTALPGLACYLDSIEKYGFGGTCYANNIYLNELLGHLGYNTRLCGADMLNPDVHLVNMVDVDGREYIVDAGYGAPFLDPLPRDITRGHVIELGRDRYVLHPQDENGNSRVDLYREGVLIHGYLAKPEARLAEDFDGVIVDSFREDATFMNAILLARFKRGESLVVHNYTVFESRGAEWSAQELSGVDVLARFIDSRFGIPEGIVLEIVEEMGQLKNPWS